MPASRELTAESKVQLLLQIFYAIRDTLDLDEILNQLMDNLRTVLPYDAAGIFVLNQDSVIPGLGRSSQRIAGMARRGFDDHPAESDAMLSEGMGIVGHVIQNGGSVVIPDVRLEPRYVIGRRRTRSEIAVPILQKAYPIGALNLESDEPGAYSPGDLEVLEFFANAASISIEKAMLHLQLLEKKSLEKQLQIAHQVQSRLLPERSPDLRDYEITGLSLPTGEIGGDYFDYIPLGENRLGLAVADVSGKGIPAALIMSSFRALLRAQVTSAPDPVHAMQQVNVLLHELTALSTFVTCAFGVLHLEDGDFSYVNCGHDPPLLVRRNGKTELLQTGGPLLGIFTDASYEGAMVHLDPGDQLLLYTDGVVESNTPDLDDFGWERLAAVVRRTAQLSAVEATEEILAATRRHFGSESYEDDFTLVLVRRRSQPTKAARRG